MRCGTLILRYKRFLADVVLDAPLENGEIETTVHVPNPGAMLGLSAPGMKVWVSESGSKTRKLPLTWELVEADGGLVGVNTMNPNRIVAEALIAGAIPELAAYLDFRPEVKYGEASRIDFLLTDPNLPDCWLEVKNCHLMRTPGLAEFPDCVAARSARHLRELEAMRAKGDRAVQLFIIQRTDCEAFDTAGDLDPTYHAALRHAFQAGVEVLCYTCEIDTSGVRLTRRIPWRGANEG